MASNSGLSALSLYVSACRLVIEANGEDHLSSFNEQKFYRVLPQLRKSLTCYVCNSLSLEPMVPVERVNFNKFPVEKCQHHTCRKCAGAKNKTKQNCEWCRNCNLQDGLNPDRLSGFEPSTQLRILIQCYKKLCLYLITTPIFRKLGTVNANGGTSSLADMIQEGSEFNDDYKYLGRSPSNLGTVFSALEESPPAAAENDTLKIPVNGLLTFTKLVEVKSIPTADTSDPEITFKQPRLSVNHNSVVPAVKPKYVRSNQNNKRRGCRCGNASPSPGKLTCCGQRCPCYVNGKGCLGCTCRGCRNPKKFVPAERVASPLSMSPAQIKIEVSTCAMDKATKELDSEDFDTEKLSLSESSDVDIDIDV